MKKIEIEMNAEELRLVKYLKTKKQRNNNTIIDRARRVYGFPNDHSNDENSIFSRTYSFPN